MLFNQFPFFQFRLIPYQQSPEDFHENAPQNTSSKASYQATCDKNGNMNGHEYSTNFNSKQAFP